MRGGTEGAGLLDVAFVTPQISDVKLSVFPQDELLTKEEILDNWNMFVGSQATNYGEDLTKNHDEL